MKAIVGVCLVIGLILVAFFMARNLSQQPGSRELDLLAEAGSALSVSQEPGVLAKKIPSRAEERPLELGGLSDSKLLELSEGTFRRSLKANGVEQERLERLADLFAQIKDLKMRGLAERHPNITILVEELRNMLEEFGPESSPDQDQ